MDSRLPDGVPKAVQLQPPQPGGNEGPGPFLVQFTSGFQPGVDGELRWEIYRHKKGGGRYVIVARSEHSDFVGYTHGLDRAGPTPCMYALGHLGEGGSMTYRAATGQHVVRLEPRVPGHPYGPVSTPYRAPGEPELAAAAGRGADGVDEKAARRAATKRLVEQFGSTRRKRQLTSKELSAVTPESIENPEQVAKLLDAAHARAVAGGTTKAEVLAAAAAARNIPPHHPEATTGPDAYRLREIIPPGAWHALQPSDIAAIATEAREAEITGADVEETRAAALPGYVRSRLRLLGGELQRPVFKRRARALGWLAALLLVHGSGNMLKPRRSGGLAAIAEQRNVQVEVLEAILELFYVKTADDAGSEVWSRPEAKKTLMLHYVFVTALLLEDCQLAPAQFEALRAQLKMKAGDVVARFRELGATATPMKQPGVGSPSKDLRQYHVALLPPEAASALEPRTLADAFPKAKAGRKGGGR